MLLLGNGWAVGAVRVRCDYPIHLCGAMRLCYAFVITEAQCGRSETIAASYPPPWSSSRWLDA